MKKNYVANAMMKTGEIYISKRLRLTSKPRLMTFPRLLQSFT